LEGVIMRNAAQRKWKWKVFSCSTFIDFEVFGSWLAYPDLIPIGLIFKEMEKSTTEILVYIQGTGIHLCDATFLLKKEPTART
jgi:hypothetical protein